MCQAIHTSYNDAIGKVDTWDGYTQQEQVGWETWMKTFLVVLYLFYVFFLQDTMTLFYFFCSIFRWMLVWSLWRKVKKILRIGGGRKIFLFYFILFPLSSKNILENLIFFLFWTFSWTIKQRKQLFVNQKNARYTRRCFGECLECRRRCLKEWLECWNMKWKWQPNPLYFSHTPNAPKTNDTLES